MLAVFSITPRAGRNTLVIALSGIQRHIIYLDSGASQSRDRKDVGKTVRSSVITPGGMITCTTGPLTGSKDLGWRTGQVLRGMVTGNVAAGTYLITVNGRDVVARSPYALFKDQTIVMEVRGRDGDQYLVRLLHSLEDSEGIKGLLTQLGLKDTPLMRALITGFLAKQLPLKQELLQRAVLMLEIMEGNSLEEVEIVLQVLNMDRPPAPRVLEALQAFIVGEKETLKGNESKLLPFIRRLADLLEYLTASQRQNASLLYRQLTEMIASMVLRPEEGTERVLAQLQSLLRAQLPVSGRKEGTVGHDRLINGIKGDLGEVGLEQQNKVQAFSGLLERFSRLLREFREGVQEAGSMPEGQRIVREGEILERQMAGHQLFQSLKQEDCLYFNLPFINNGETETWGQLRIMKDTGSQKIINPQRFSMTILLNTENLGPLLMQIKVCNKEVQASGKVREERVARLLKMAWPGLQEAFAAMGYHLQQCRWQVGTFADKLQPVITGPSGEGLQLRYLDRLV